MTALFGALSLRIDYLRADYLSTDYLRGASAINMMRTGGSHEGGLVGTNEEVDSAKVFQLLSSYYTGARTELVQRMVIRESTLTLFLGASAGLFSFATGGGPDRYWVLFIVPFLSLGTAAISLQHTASIRAIGRYLATEFQAEVAKVLTPAPIHWDVSRTRVAGLRTTSTMRAVAATLLIVIPGGGAPAMAVLVIPRQTASYAAAAAGAVAVLLALILLIRSYSGQPWATAEPQAPAPDQAAVATPADEAVIVAQRSGADSE
jgi:hypothetical protein